MEKNIFRKQSIEQVSSPEQLNDYIKVAEPGVWLVLAGILVLLAGVCVWGIFGRLDSTIRTGAISANGVLTFYVREDDAERVEPGMKLTAGDGEYAVASVSAVPEQLPGGDDLSPDFSYMMRLGELSVGEWVCAAEAETDLSDGVYDIVITTGSVSPLSFIIN